MIDFQPLLTNPKLMIFGAAAQFGIFFTLALASLLGYDLKDAASISIIGAADGPTSIFVATELGSQYLGVIMVAKVMNLFSKEKINPMIGAAGISAFPMSARVVHKLGLEEDNSNFLLMHSIGVNVSGQIASVIADGLILALVKAKIGG